MRKPGLNLLQSYIYTKLKFEIQICGQILCACKTHFLMLGHICANTVSHSGVDLANYHSSTRMIKN